MKITGRRIESFLARPDPGVRAVLLYGPDAGRVQELLDRLTKGVGVDPADPFRLADLSAAAVIADPARLPDEVAALSFTGGRRVVRIRDADDRVAPALKAFLAQPVGEALTLLAAAELGPRSALRTTFEQAENAAALPCYADDEDTLSALITGMLAADGVAVADDALAYLVGHLGGDRLLTRREIEKLALLVGPGATVTLADATASVGDNSALNLDDLCFAALGGDAATALRVLDRVLHTGVTPPTVLRALARHVERLHLTAGRVAAGQPLDQAMKALRPPVLFMREAAFRAQVRGWDAGRLATVLANLIASEEACKSTGAPAEPLCGHALMAVAQRAPRPPGPPRRGP